MNNNFSFLGGDVGQWTVVEQSTISGEPILGVKKIQILNELVDASEIDCSWVLRGFTSNVRYANRDELIKLKAKQQGLNRQDSLCAAMIPIKKNVEWWLLSQDERRAIFEEQSHHTQIGLSYLPQIARQLHHSRDLNEPFDFITWFEFAPENTQLFNQLLEELRLSKEWQFVEREIDIRLIKNG